MKKLILATNNQDKIKEIKDILKNLDVSVLTVADFDDFPEIEETGNTLLENAILKARGIWDRYLTPCIADDTGLEVDYLNGAPGVLSARFAGENCTYDDNNTKLLELLQNVPDAERTARFKTVIAFIDHNGELHTVEGTVDGRIANIKKGKYGFGYDPIFFIPEKNKSLAEMTPEQKNTISHRGKAVRKIAPIIIQSFQNNTKIA